MNLNCKNIRTIGFLLTIVTLVGCHSKKETETTRPALEVPEKVDVVIGIGRVLPEEGIVNLATEIAGIIDRVNKISGDSVQKGAVIISLNQSDAKLEILKLQNEIQAQRHLIQSNESLTRQYRVQLSHKDEVVSVSRELVESGNETLENLRNYEMERGVIQNQLEQNLESTNVNRMKLRELEVMLDLAKNQLEKLSVRAPFDGILLTQDAQVGAAIQPFQSFAKFAISSPLIVEGEADEMFANRLEIGQNVKIHYLGNEKVIAEGVIFSLSPDLSNKSLFNDEPDELQDRRVRKFKVRLTTMENLLLNSKVECNIQI